MVNIGIVTWIGGVSTVIIAAYIRHYFDLRRLKKENVRQISSVLNAIESEIQVIIKLIQYHKENISESELEQARCMKLAIASPETIIYNNSAKYVGDFGEAAASIVNFYTHISIFSIKCQDLSNFSFYTWNITLDSINKYGKEAIVSINKQKERMIFI